MVRKYSGIDSGAIVVDKDTINIYEGGTTENLDKIYAADLYDHLKIYNIVVTDTLLEGAFKRFIVHEMGHAFDNAVDKKGRAAVLTRKSDLLTGADPYTYNGFYKAKKTGWQWRLNTPKNKNVEEEIFADQFIGWVYNKWETRLSGGLTELGQLRKDFMDENMAFWITEIIGYNHHRR